MNHKAEVKDEVYKSFEASNDFNGILISTLSTKSNISYSKLINILIDLVKEDAVTIQFGTNPHIITFCHYDVDRQIEVLEEGKKNEVKVIKTLPNDINFSVETHSICVYPSTTYLNKYRDISAFSMSPFSRELALGQPQLKPLYFDLEVLDRYFRDPRYSFKFDDYSGRISYHEDGVTDLRKEDQFFLETFGLGFDENKERVVTVYLRYLSDLTPEHQLYWQSKKAKQKCNMLPEYYANTIEGKWTTSYSVFSAFIEEQRVINELCIKIFDISLFNRSFEEEKRPKEFTFFLIPTLDNYNQFVSLLDKMVSDNINKSFFKGKVELFEQQTGADGLVVKKDKGTLRLLEEWLNKVYKTSDRTPIDDVFKPFKKIRRERQSPAHRIKENVYNKDFSVKQKNLIKEAYYSMQSLRLIFQAHKDSKSVNIPTWLDNGDIKIF